MNPDSPSFVCHVLVVKADRLCAGILGQAARRLFPAATIRVTNSLKAARGELNAQPVQLLLTGFSLPDGDALGLLGEIREGLDGTRRTLVVTSRCERQILTSLRALPVHGVFDPTTEGPEELGYAIGEVAKGEHYWSSSVLKRIGVPDLPAGPIDRLLSPTEQLVFAVIGDGSDDKEAADRLQLKPSTVHSVRRELHRKLGVQHKGELIRLAVLHGYVRFTAEGVQRPGFASLLAARSKRHPTKGSGGISSSSDTPPLRLTA